MKNSIGQIISGSLSEGFVMRFSSQTDIETIKSGKFVCIQGLSHRFFSIITDLMLETAHPEILQFPPDEGEGLLKELLTTNSMYATAQLKPMLMLNSLNHISPVKTVPHHFASVYEATRKDIETIFGDEKDVSNNYFNIGNPLDMDAPVCLNLHNLAERSNGVFGKTGTGKTFITRLILAGLIKSNKATCLIFDMHSEYGLEARQEGSGTFVKGLKTLFPSKIAIFSIDPVATQRRGTAPDVAVKIPYQDIHVEDIMSLQQELNLHATATEAAYLLHGKYKKDWLAVLLSKGINAKELAEEIGAHPESIAALYRKLKHIEKYSFFTPDPVPSVTDTIIEYLDKRKSIIFEFGNYSSTFCYLLVANIITRRIHSSYIQKTERFLGTKKPELEPSKLMIVIEEAHKFLNPTAASQTIFGTIAREMRKYYVSLFIIDQRPSGIDPEILSQVGTKVIAQLSDEKDVQAVLSGSAQANTLKTVLNSLDTKKQALVIGHAVRMPIVIETRTYDQIFYKAMQLDASINIENDLF
ncbi:ATPase [Candidatus Chromulinivorax destructor]|uniref:ATPase n=2 Tax=Candidatus Chromulinivorax destructor TaxID=2066483 RepID=A0A345ZBY3_9BACT|nr:ATPase [Candidatus Chromulinivorax destructor]